jgi:hypothetical protein
VDSDLVVGRRRPEPEVTVSTKQQMIDSVAQGLGAIVTWDLFGTQVKPADLRAILAAEGITDIAVPDIDPEHGVRRAASAWRQGRGNADRYMAQVVFSDSNVVEVGILKHDRVDAHEVRWVQVDKATWDLKAKTWASVGASSEARDYVAAANDAMTYLDHEFIRPQILQKKMGEFGAVPLRRQGGTYYVPRQHDAALQALARVVGKIGDSDMDVLHVATTASSVKTIEKNTRAHVGASVEELRGKLTEWTSRASGVREDSAIGLLTEFKGLRQQVELYADALQVSMDDLFLELDKAIGEGQALVDKIAGVNGEARTRAPRAANVDRWSKAIAAAIERGCKGADGVVEMTTAFQTEFDLPPSAFKYSAVLVEANRGLFATLGYRARLLSDRSDWMANRLRLTPLEGGPRTEPTEGPATVAAQPSEPAPAAQEPVSAAPEATVEESKVHIENGIDVDALRAMPQSDVFEIAVKMNIQGRTKMGKKKLIEAIVAAQPQ